MLVVESGDGIELSIEFATAFFARFDLSRRLFEVLAWLLFAKVSGVWAGLSSLSSLLSILLPSVLRDFVETFRLRSAGNDSFAIEVEVES